MQPLKRKTGSGWIFHRMLAIALVMGFVASACGGSTASTATEAPVPDATSAVEETSAAAETLSGEFAALDGTTIDLATLQGEDVVLWFWAPW